MSSETSTGAAPFASPVQTVRRRADFVSASRRAISWRTAVPIAAALLVGAVAGGAIMAWRGSGDERLFSVNGTEVTRRQFEHRLEAVSGNTVAQQLLNEQLQLDFARKQGATPTDAQVQARYDSLSKQPNFAAQLTANHQTADDIRHSLQVEMAKVNLLTKGVTVTDADAQAYYQREVDPRNPAGRYHSPEAIQIAAVLSDREGDIDQARKELAGGAPFAEVAAKYSKDRSKANGGVLPAIPRGKLDSKKFPGLEEAIYRLQVGQQIDKIKVAGAWWLIRCVGKQAGKMIPFDVVRDECRNNALLAKAVAVNGKSVDAAFAAYRGTASIVSYSPQYQVKTGAPAGAQ